MVEHSWIIKEIDFKRRPHRDGNVVEAGKIYNSIVRYIYFDHDIGKFSEHFSIDFFLRSLSVMV